MPLSPGNRLGPYEIVSRIGAGGMGEVWRAKDTRLDRSVAIKILPAELAQNAQFKIRFEREAKTISQLSHPNICTLFDVGDDYLVMELLEGESLADRLTKGPLPLSEVIRYGVQIADALDRAHRAGIVHRDLKPGNIMLTKSGAKLLDFGLAKSGVQPPSAVLMEGATAAKPLTQEGTILGTFQYMAPEQLEGQEADARTDIFALGAVLYEMAAARRAFEGKTKTSLIASIVSGEPKPISDVQPLAPPALEHVIRKCLSKDPDDRWQSAHDVAEELRWISEAGSAAGVATRMATTRRVRYQFVIALSVLFATAAALMSLLYVREAQSARRPFVADLIAPNNARFNAVGDEGGPAVVSPDGKLVVFSVAEGTTTRLWARSLENGETKVLVGTEGGMFPFWSPDSRNVGFFSGQDLRRIDMLGGAPITVTSAINARGGSWGKGDVILFTPTTLDAIYWVPASGGKATPVTKVDHTRHTTHRWPSFLPDGKHFLYLASNHQDATGGSNALYLGSIDGGEPRLVMNSLSNGVVADGYLLVNRQGTLFAQTMTNDGILNGDPKPIAEDVLYDRGIWRGGFSVSNTGILLFHAGQGSIGSRLVWFDRSGKQVGILGERDMYWDVQISPDQQKLAVCIGDPSRQSWVIDLKRNTRTKLQLDARWTGVPTWSPDSGTLYLGIIRDDGPHLVAKRLDGGPATTILNAGDIGSGAGLTVSPDGRTLIFNAGGTLWRTSTTSLQQPAAMTAKSSFNRYDPLLSRNGKWLSYTSNENGHDDVFIARANDITQKWQVSTAGGRMARWRADGKEFFFVDSENRINAVPIHESNDGLEVGNPQPLFSIAPRYQSRSYDVTADGQRFIVNSLADQPSPNIRIVTNWEQRLRK